MLKENLLKKHLATYSISYMFISNFPVFAYYTGNKYHQGIINLFKFIFN